MNFSKLSWNFGRYEQTLSYLVLLLLAGLILWAVWPSLNDHGYLTAWDAGGHLLKASYFAHHLLPLGHLSGWFPLWHGGFDLFQFYPPLLYYLLGPLTLVMQPELALRLFTAALWVGLIPVTYYFLRSFSLRPVLAALGTSLLLALSTSAGIGPDALYGTGFLPNGLGFILAVFLLGRLKRDLSEPSRSSRQLLLTGLVFGLLVLAHAFNAYWWLLASLLLLLSELAGRQSGRAWRLKRYGFVLAVGLLVSAYWWVPFILNLGITYQNNLPEPFSRLAVLRDLLLAKGNGGVIVTTLAVLGLGSFAWHRQWRSLVFFSSLLMLSVLLALNLINSSLPLGRGISSSEFFRFQAFVLLVLFWMAAFGLAESFRVISKFRSRGSRVVSSFLLVATVFGLAVGPALRHRQSLLRPGDFPAYAELPIIAQVLETNLQPGDFVLTELNWGTSRYVQPPHLLHQRLAFFSDRIWDLGGGFGQATKGAPLPVAMAGAFDKSQVVEESQSYWRSRGVHYLITSQPGSRQVLADRSWLRPVWYGQTFSVFALADFSTPFGLPSEAGTKLAGLDYKESGRYQLNFREPVSLPAGTTLALSYHPWLAVRLDGQTASTRPDQDYRLQLVNGQDQVSQLTISYQPPFYVKLLNLLSLLSLLTILLLLRPSWFAALRRRLRRSNQRRPPV